ncbi:tryptophan transporter [Pontibacillus halophilus JSM 076056 = DSM 19796]|uniref:Tryptophan transporter n=1 Tax=Pontibacillus halophilus JSM 076056 = DSM 19796 TaxID=1385510 RepID=A0A0A5GH80_9BACI|nr:tryptophan transporter [Pontibacillus halophilus]KGX92611.1 tryptophan transporter [Pontibacillus halophilus JSM 076056 = DSM 19796]
MKLDTRVLIMLSLLVGIGAVLHIVSPPALFGMKLDMLLVMMFIGILLFPQLPYVMLLSLVTGAIAAITTTFPGGQLANIIDKPLTALVVFALLKATQKVANKKVLASVLTFIGTVISGSIFLFIGLIVLGAEGGFLALFTAIVLPTAVINTVLMTIIYPIVQQIFSRTSLSQKAA